MPKKLLQFSLLLVTLILIIPAHVYASEDINKQLEQQLKSRKCNNNSAKKLYKKICHEMSVNGLYTIYDKEGREIFLFSDPANYHHEWHTTYNFYGNIQCCSRGFAGTHENTVYFYDNDQKIIYTITASESPYTAPVIRFYNTDGLIINEISLDTNGAETSRLTYTYNSHNDLLQCIDISSSTLLKTDNHYIYDDHNRIVTLQNSTSCTVYSYDERGNLVAETKKYPSSALEYKAYTYDSENRLLTDVYIDIHGKSYIKIYTYDIVGNLHSSQYYTNNNLEESYNWFYDTNGNLLSYVHYKDNILINHDEYEYEYDSDGDLIHVYKQSISKISTAPVHKLYESYIYYEE